MWRGTTELYITFDPDRVIATALHDIHHHNDLGWSLTHAKNLLRGLAWWKRQQRRRQRAHVADLTRRQSESSAATRRSILRALEYINTEIDDDLDPVVRRAMVDMRGSFYSMMPLFPEQAPR